MRDNGEKQNIISLVTRDCFSLLSQTFSSVSIVQAFLMSIGFVSFQLGLMNTFTNIAMMLSAFLFMGKIDRVPTRKIVNLNSNLFIAIGILPVVLVILSLSGVTMDLWVTFAVVGITWAVQSFFSGLRMMVDARVAKDIFRPETYGFAFGIDGIVSNMIGIAGGLLIQQVIERDSQGHGFGAVFLLSLLFIPGAVIFSKKLHLIKKDPNDLEEKAQSLLRSMSYALKSFGKAFEDKLLREISILHIIRGINSGMFIFIFPLGVSRYGLPLSYAAYIVIVNAGAAIIGHFFVKQFYDRIGTLKSIYISSSICILSMAGFILFRSPVSFLLCLALYVVGNTVVGQSVPIGIFKVVPGNYLGTLTGVRFIIMQTAEALVAFTLGILIARLSVTLFFILIALFLLLQMLFSKRSFDLKKWDVMYGRAADESNHIL